MRIDRVPASLARRLTLPLIVAPMTTISSVELVVTACANGAIGSFPTHNASPAELPGWLEAITAGLKDARLAPAPWAANLAVHRSNRRRDADIDLLLGHGVEVVITSVGSPAPVTGLPANLLASSPHVVTGDTPTGFDQDVLLTYKRARAAGHSVCGVGQITAVADTLGIIRAGVASLQRTLGLEGVPREYVDALAVAIDL